MMSMKKAIVTGANGFIGNALLEELCKHDIEIIAVIKNKDSNIDKINTLSKVRIVYCEMDDIYNLPRLIEDRDIDACIHLAWMGSFGEERGNYEMQLKNIIYTLHTIDALAQMKVKRFVGAGTLAEKDVLNYHLIDGSTPNIVSHYGIAKLTAHFMSKVECNRLGIEHIWCYLPNTYAAGSTINNFVIMASRRMLKGERASFSTGEQMYDFMYVTDTVKALYCATEKGRNNTAYYLGSNKPRKLKEYIMIIRDAIDPRIKLYLGEISFLGKSLPEEAYDGRKLAEDTGFRPEVEFEEGIKRTIDWLRETMKDNSNAV